MKSTRTPKYVLAGVVGILGLGVGATLGPATASATTSAATSAATSTTTAVSGRVSAIKDALTGLVTDKTLSQAQADKVATTLDSKLPRGGSGHDGFGHGGHGADLDAAATAIGVTTDELRTALQSGKTMAQVAQGKGVDQATLVSKLVAAEKTEIAAAVTAGRLTQAQADTITADLQARVTAQVTSTRPVGGRGHHDDGDDAPGAPGSSASPSASASTQS